MNRIVVVLFYFFFCQMVVWSQDNNIQFSNHSQNEFKKAFLYTDSIADHYKFTSEKDSILAQFEYTKESNPNFSSLAHYLNGVFHQSDSKVNQAIQYYDSALIITNSPYLKAQFLLAKGYSLSIVSRSDEAYKFMVKAKLIATELNDIELHSSSLTGQAEVMRIIGDHDGAVNKLNDARWLMDSIGLVNKSYVKILDRLSTFYARRGQEELTIQTTYLAIKIADSLQNKHLMASSHNLLGYLYEHNGTSDSSFYHYQKAMNYWTELNAGAYLANNFCNMARLLQKEGDYAKSKYYLLKGDSLAKNSEWLSTKMELYSMLSFNAFTSGDSLNYYKYATKSTRSYLEFMKRSSNDKIVGLEIQYEQSENLRLIESQEAQIQSKQREQQQYYFIIIVVVLVLISVLVWLKYTLNKKKKIAQMNRELENLLHVKNGLLKEVHHRVKNNLQMISGLLTIQAKNTTDELAKQSLLESRSRLQSMAIVHKRLYVGEAFDKIKLDTFIKDIVATFVDTTIRTQDVFELDYDKYTLHIEQAVPLGLVLHELISNSFKHAWEDGDVKKISISMKKNANNELEVNYADNGKGLGTNGEKESQSSLGMKLLNLMVEKQLKGELNIKSEDGLKTQFKFKLRALENEI